jgi:putative cardiolipin synthase
VTHQAVRHIALLACLALLASGCAGVPFDHPKTESSYIADTAGTALGREVAEWSAEHPGASGFYGLDDGLSALAARIWLINSAERSLDLQYFILKGDATGQLVAAKLLAAADRGVRVRFLIDDIMTKGLDDGLIALNTHPNIEVRIFNPLTRQSFKFWSMVVDFGRANRRMHNKSLTADSQLTIVGGRNLGDEYFDLHEGSLFIDMDLIAAGPVAREVSDVFDMFWNSDKAVPMEAFDKGKNKFNLEQLREFLDGSADSRAAYEAAFKSQLVADLLDDRVHFVAAPYQVLTDRPDKLDNPIAEEHQILVTELGRAAYVATSELIIVSPYFIPRDSGMIMLRDLVTRGIRVIVVTNSLAANNHVPVHSAYSKYRKPLLEAGVEIYELRVDAAALQTDDAEEDSPPTTLHAKAVIVDQKWLFVGSLNIDPRSIEINTEMGLVLESPILATEFRDSVMVDIELYAYKVSLNDKGDLEWIAQGKDGREVFSKEPQTSFGRRFGAGFYRILPEGQL